MIENDQAWEGEASVHWGRTPRVPMYFVLERRPRSNAADDVLTRYPSEPRYMYTPRKVNTESEAGNSKGCIGRQTFKQGQDAVDRKFGAISNGRFCVQHAAGPLDFAASMHALWISQPHACSDDHGRDEDALSWQLESSEVVFTSLMPGREGAIFIDFPRFAKRGPAKK